MLRDVHSLFEIHSNFSVDYRVQVRKDPGVAPRRGLRVGDPETRPASTVDEKRLNYRNHYRVMQTPS